MLDTTIEKRALDELVFRYAMALDQKDWTQYRQLLIVDVVFDFSDHCLAEAGVSKIVRGADAVVSAAMTAMQGFEATQHCITNTVHKISGTRAATRCYLIAEHFLNNSRGDRNVGCGALYEIESRRTSDGWKIAKLTFNTLWMRGNTGLYAIAAEQASHKQDRK